MDLTDKIDSLIEQVSNLNCLNQIIETILVDDSIGSIESFKTIKDVDSIRHIKEDINFKLKTTRLLIKSNLLMDNTIVISDIDEETISNNSCIFECIAKNTNNIFAKEFFNLKKLEKHELSFFKQPFFKKIFSPVTEKDVFNKIDQIGSNYSWIIIPNIFKSFFINNKDFTTQDYSDKKIIHNFGKYKDLNVWVNPDQKAQTIYFGKYDSLTLIINKNLKINDLKCFNDTYQLNKSISVEYLFIENLPISSLTLI
jgi:hypothetical protein